MSFDIVFQHYYPRLCDFAFRFLNDPDKAEDVVQDTFVKFYEHKSILSSHPNVIKDFLYTSVKHACFNNLRHEKVVERYYTNNKIQDFDKGFTLDSIIHAEVIGKIHKTLKNLPAGCAEVFRMAYFEELSNQEISIKLDINISTVKSQKKRALDLLKQKINPEILMLILPILLEP